MQVQKHKKKAPLVAIIGVDGCGKSTVIAAIKERFEEKRENSVYVLHRSKKMASSRTAGQIQHHDLPPYSIVLSIGKLFYKALVWIRDYYIHLALIRKKITVMLCDHFYFYYLIIDPKRFRYGGPSRLAWIVAKLLPEPDITIMLDAPFDVVYQRKQEISPEAMQSLIQAHHQLLPKLTNTYVVDANRPLTEVVEEVQNLVLKELN